MTETKLKQEMLRIADEFSGIDLMEMSVAEKKVALIAFRAVGFDAVPVTGGVVNRPRHSYVEQADGDCNQCGHPRNYFMHDTLTK
jgi:hypothetical protein